jgi:hypothetical protein
MHAKTRQYVRKAARDGLRAEVATDIGFADEYHAQLTSVFARQGLMPTYGPERVRQLIGCLQPTGQVLLLRIRDADGRCLATGVSVGAHVAAYNWGAASDRSEGSTHATKLLWWEAVRYWKARGAIRYDMGGAGDYKSAYGGRPITEYRFHRSRYPAMAYGRAAIRRLVRVRQRVLALCATSRPD